MKRFFYLLTLAGLVLGSCGDDDEDYAVIAGNVSETVANLQGGVTYLSGVEVSLTGSNIARTTVVTDALGNYRFEKLKRGQYTLRFNSTNYMAQDTTLNLFELTYYPVNIRMKYDLAGGSGEWKTTDGRLTLTLQNNLFTLTHQGESAAILRGFYAVNGKNTQVSFTNSADEEVFQADYLGAGSLIVFLSAGQAPIDGSTRFYFYKSK